MSSYELLINEHELLVAQAGAVEQLLDPDTPAAEAALAARGQLAGMLHSHLAREDVDIYPKLIVCRDFATAATARKFQSDFGRLVDNWTAYLSRWGIADARADWPRFCDETRDILTQLSRRIAQENTLLYPAALGASVIALRA